MGSISQTWGVLGQPQAPSFGPVPPRAGLLNPTDFGAGGVGGDDTDALTAWINALNKTGQAGWWPGGVYGISGLLPAISNPALTIWAAKGATVLKPLTALGGTALVYRPTAYSTYPVPGGVFGLRIDGTDAGADDIGFEYGDMNGFSYDLDVENFGGAGAIGLWEISKLGGGSQCERTSGRATVNLCTNNVIFDGGAGGTSHDYGVYDFTCSATVGGKMLTIRNGALLVHDSLRLKGNANPNSTIFSQDATSEISSFLDLQVEADGAGVTDLDIAGGARFNCWGIVDFLDGAYTPVSNIPGPGQIALLGSWRAGAAWPGLVTGSLAADVPLPLSTPTVINQFVLGKGLYRVSFSGTLEGSASGNASVELYVALSAGTILGSGSQEVNILASGVAGYGLTTTLEITGANTTVQLIAEATGVAATAKAATPSDAKAQATGYEAVLVQRL